MERIPLQVGAFEVNCSIIATDGAVYVVDPGAEGERVARVLREKGLKPTAILLTHAHFDHIGGIEALQQAFPDLPVYVHAKDRPMFGHPLNVYPPDYPQVKVPANLRNPADLADVEALETPGHTPGGVSYFFREAKLLLSGDTLFAGSVGRTDLPGGDMATLVDSLKKLVALPDDTKVVPGHGPETTLGAEKATNPFLAR